MANSCKIRRFLFNETPTMGITLKNFIFQKMLLKVKKRTAETAGVTVISIVSFSFFF